MNKTEKAYKPSHSLTTIPTAPIPIPNKFQCKKELIHHESPSAADTSSLSIVPIDTSSSNTPAFLSRLKKIKKIVTKLTSAAMLKFFSLSKTICSRIYRGQDFRWNVKEGSLDSWPGPLTESLFSIHRVMGKGAYGNVKSVTINDEKTDQNVHYALKVLNKRKLVDKNTSLENIFMERHILANITKFHPHPFIVLLFQTMQNHMALFLCMEICLGGDLAYHLKRREFSLDEVKFYACELLLALEFLHSKQINVIHRDIKPNNILLTAAGHVKLCDFGLACIDSGMGFAGTIKYAAPEVFSKLPYNHLVDMWSLGHTLFELLVRRMIWQKNKKVKIPSDEFRLLLSTQNADVIISRFHWPFFLETPQLEDDFGGFKALLTLLFQPEVQKRVSAKAARQLPFFNHIDWVAYERKEIIPIFVPSSQFYLNRVHDCMDDEEMIDIRFITEKENERFAGFEWSLLSRKPE